MENLEKRYFDRNDIEFRAVEEEGKRFLVGYAAVFDKRSRLILENGKQFYESVKRGAFDDVLKQEDLDVKLVFNHDKNKILARTVSGTLSLSADDKGLAFRAEIPNVSYANDVYELIKRGDLFSNSFAFKVAKDGEEWGKNEEGVRTRSINKIKGLYDVSVVVDACYTDTSLSVVERSFEDLEKNEKEQAESMIYKSSDTYKRKTKLLKLKNNFEK